MTNEPERAAREPAKAQIQRAALLRVVEKEECIAHPEESKTFTTSRLPDLDADTGRLRKACCLPQLRLSDDLMERRDIDLELFEFLTAPASVQMMDPEKWVETCEIACCDNHWWMHMQKGDTGSKCPYCKLCSHWAEPCHLKSNGCRQKVLKYTRQHDDHVGPMLQEILTALDRKA